MSDRQTLKSCKCLNSFTLKLIAIICMTIDHVGAVVGTKFVNGNLYLSGAFNVELYGILRSIGRIAFPIFCYLIVEGYYHTGNVRKYALRLFIFALISQIPFSLAVYKTPFDFSGLNVFFTLCMGLICVITVPLPLENRHTPTQIAFSFISIIGITALSILLNTDYSIFGISLILIFYIFRGEPVKIFIAMLICILLFENPRELFALISIIPIALHNGKKGPSIKYAFYVYYPLHLTILYFIYKTYYS